MKWKGDGRPCEIEFYGDDAQGRPCGRVATRHVHFRTNDQSFSGEETIRYVCLTHYDAILDMVEPKRVLRVIQGGNDGEAVTEP